jgi:hypothetical protein
MLNNFSVYSVALFGMFLGIFWGARRMARGDENINKPTNNRIWKYG